VLNEMFNASERKSLRTWQGVYLLWIVGVPRLVSTPRSLRPLVHLILDLLVAHANKAPILCILSGRGANSCIHKLKE
ncbi:uncharacterized protein METZ01_LOCUS46938, partial [marine metagenome]